MANHGRFKKKWRFVRTFISFITAIPSALRVTKYAVELLKLEVRIAGQSMISLCLILIFAGSILTSTWLCILGLIGWFLYYQQWGWPWIFISLIVFNLLTLVCLVYICSRIKKRLAFPLTSQFLHQLPFFGSD